MIVVNPRSTPILQRLPVLWAFLSYLGLTLILTDPLIRQIGSALPSDPGDPILNTWILWWNTKAMPLSDRWWSPPAFFPIVDTLTFSEHLLGLLPISGLVQWLSSNPILAYNVAFLLSFPLSGLSAYLLSRELTGRDDAPGWPGYSTASPLIASTICRSCRCCRGTGSRSFCSRSTATCEMNASGGSFCLVWRTCSRDC